MRQGKPLSKVLSASTLVAAALIVCAAIYLSSPGANAASDPKKVFSSGQTIDLAKAIAANNATKVRDLVQHGASLAERGQAGVTLLQWAMLRERPAMVELLVALGADPAQRGYGSQTALHMAAMAKGKPYLKFFLDHGADPNMRGGSTDAPVLSEALMSRNHDAVTLLLAYHADPNAPDRLEPEAFQALLRMTAKLRSA